MSLKLGTNMESLRAVRRLSEVTSTLGSVFERLSTGLRINNPADDSAGLTIANSLGLQQAVYTQGIRNVNDGISMLNIAQGGLEATRSIVFRIGELAEKAANGACSGIQRVALDREANTLVKEYNRIISTVSLNGRNLLDGTTTSVTIQEGFGTADTTVVRLGTELGLLAGDGTFNAPITLAGGSAEDLASGDINNDGKIDILGRSALYLSRGDGTFSTVAFATGASVESAVLVDLNQDGKLDLLTNESTTLSARLGNGDGTFRARMSSLTIDAPSDIAIGDLNNDGLIDVAIGSTSNIVGQQAERIFIGNGDGTFRAPTSITTNAHNYGNVLADFNGDGNQDLVFAEADGGTKIWVNYGRGDGTFATPVTFALATNGAATQFFVGDYNDDGHKDIVAANYMALGLDVYLGTSTGSFNRTIYTVPGAGGSGDVARADVNGDNIDDFIVGNYQTDQLHIMIGNADGTFRLTRSISSNIADLYGAVDSADYNHDGVPDIASYDNNATALYVFFGNGDSSGRRNNLIDPVDLTSILGARDALSWSRTQMERVDRELSSLGASQERLGFAVKSIDALRLSLEEAQSRIMDADIAESAAELVAAQVRQQAVTAVLGQANQQMSLVLKLVAGQ